MTVAQANKRFALDNASPLSGMQRMKLVTGLAANLDELGDLAMSPASFRRRMSLLNAIREALDALDAGMAPATPEPTPAVEQEDAPPAPRKATAHYYEFDPTRKKSQRKRDNAAAMALLNKIDAGEIDPASLTGEQKATLAKYSGTGGNLTGADGMTGSDYEYYTPKPVAEGIWDLMGALGFSGGKVLDPCAGVGIFGATAPITAAVDAVELNETSGRINGLVNDGPGYHTTVSPFEAVAASTPDEVYDAVVTNVPFAKDVYARGGNNALDDRYQDDPIENYFILRSLEKLKPGGLAAFITPPRCVSGKNTKQKELRVASSYMAEFLGAYRLPNQVFGTASADTITDVIFYRKYSRETLDKINELRQQSPKTLIDANVQWQDFVTGRYFDTEGKRFVLGEFVPKDPTKYRDSDRVINPASVAEIGKMLKRFPGSRINWEMLNTTETETIVYRNGDTITQAGVTLEWQDGEWIPRKKTDKDTAVGELLEKMASPFSAFSHKVTYAQACDLYDQMIALNQSIHTPDWLRGIVNGMRALPGDDGAKYWAVGLTGLAVEQVLHDRLADEVGVNFLTEYPTLSESMKRHINLAASAPSALGGYVKGGLAKVTTHYNKKTGYSAVWRGDVAAEVATIEVTPDGSFEGLRYRSKSIWTPIEEAKKIFGEDFDPYESPNWCVSPDGTQVTRADDYYVGNYGEFLNRVDEEIASAKDERIKQKLLRQKLDAMDRIDVVDTADLTFNLFSPHITAAEKVEFLRRYVHPNAVLVYDEVTGAPRPDIDIPNAKTDHEKLCKRVGDYLKNGTITLGGTKFSTMSDQQAFEQMRKIIATANEQLNAWTHSNTTIMNRMRAKANDPTALRFRHADDEGPVNVPGMNPELTLHGYQNSFVRKCGREFGGINGFGVGLGKTFTALASVQYVQSIGVKKKTVFVVPNAVLSNWKKEASFAYQSTSDCLFVGWRAKRGGKEGVNSAKYDEDLTAILENRHSKIFMTMEAFERIKMRDENIENYIQYIRSVDATFAESEKKKEDERAKGKVVKTFVEILAKKSSNAPYLEDMGIDSVVIDEAHFYKNSSDAIDFDSAKYLSIASASARGLDAQAKAWYIRGKSPAGDGILMLTATPITNSPLEIYSMLTLSVGHERINKACLDIKGADAFMEMMCTKIETMDVSIDGIERNVSEFIGLSNVNVLRRALGDIATIREAKDVGQQVVVPDRDLKETNVQLSRETTERLQTYKKAFRYASDMKRDKTPNRGDPDAYEQVSEWFGEPDDLIAHPFNLINKMTLLIADPELDKRATFYTYIAAQNDKALKACDQFNELKLTEERGRPGPMTRETSIVGQVLKKNKKQQVIEELVKIRIEARIDVASNRIIIDTMDPETQGKFEAIAESLGLDLDVTVPPKLAAMLENYQAEQATPRGMNADGVPSHIVKQIVFCDILALHHKIKRLLIKRAGVPPGAVAIITGKTNNKPDEIMAVQEGFNADGEDNVYRAIVANEKAEVGINLQKGTQAIHHLTIGWTPDSLEQRNGRGVRQGNKTKAVTIYYYDADGTFDAAKRTMVDKKAEWIGDLLDKNGGNSVAITGGLSSEQLEMLADTVGDVDATRKMREMMLAQEAETRANTIREKQNININTVRVQREFLDKSFKDILEDKLVTAFKLSRQLEKVMDKIQSPTATLTAIAKNQAIHEEVSATLRGLCASLDEAADIALENYSGYGNQMTGTPISAYDVIEYVKQKEKTEPKMLERLRGSGSLPRVKIAPKEVGALFDDWQTEVAMATSMMEESIRNFERHAKEPGALPACVVKAFGEGKAMFFMGKPVMVGMFANVNNGEALMMCDTVYGSTPGMIKRLASGEEWESRFPLFGEIDWIYPGTPGYDECITLAAQIEDRQAESGFTFSGFSKIVPEVAQRRVVETVATYRVNDYLLPPPYFPHVADTTKELAPAWAKIAEQQKAIVKRVFRGGGWSSDVQFTVPSSVAVVYTGAYRGPSRGEMLREFAIANGMKLTHRDIGWYDLSKVIAATFKADGVEDALTGTDEATLREQAQAVVNAQVSEWYEVGEQTLDLPSTVVAVLREKLQALNPEQLTQVQTPASQSGVEGDPEEAVGIAGNTWPWKDDIKRVASRHGGSKWDGTNKMWNIRRKAWVALLAENPSAAKDLRLTKATKFDF